ncbi:YciI family protein [Pectobacterium carotovorum]|uniref:YciI family protein n=1 Tax=Pectobacterium carotovorum TaxID=554 RepID=UPI00193E0221|nr:YciI family protein [Pectobacterium carotovorum]QRN36441.1 hypothetical protein IHJ55_10905 [Pectobacterium carotovorum]
MLYVIYAEDNVDSLAKRLSVRPDHLARLQALRDQGRLITAGPLPAIDSDDPGHCGPVTFTSRSTTATIPVRLALAGVYKHVSVKPFKKVF